MSIDLILQTLRKSGKKLIFAESVTGGLLVDAFISVPGASDVVLGSEVTYANELKAALLGVDESVIAEQGAVSAEVAIQMAQGVCAVGQASSDLLAGQVIALSTTGSAGPEGNPVGQVFIALHDGKRIKIRELGLSGSRREIREKTVLEAVSMLREHLDL